MTEISEYEDGAFPETRSVGFESDSAGSDTSGSYEEEDLYSSESDYATEFNSRVQSLAHLQDYDSTTKAGPTVSYHSLGSTVVLDEAGSIPGSRLTSGREWSPQLSKQEMIRQIHLRRHIDDLKKTVEDKQHKVDGCRAQLQQCREHLNSLLAQEATLQTKVTDQEEGRVKGHSLGLNKSQLVKVRAEISTEENVEIDIQNKLQRAELELSEAQMAAGKFEDMETDLVRGEEAAKDVKRRQAVKRMQAENKLVVDAERARKTKEKRMEATLRSQEKQTMVMVEQTRQAQEKGKQFLQETLDRRKREEAIEGDKYRSYLDGRIKAMLSLKKNIESSQSTIQAQQMLKTEKSKKRQVQDRRERERILSEGGNPDETFLRRQRMESFELNKESFRKRQNERQVEIINRLLDEEKMLKKIENKIAKSHWHERQECPHPTKRLSSKKRRARRIKYRDSDGISDHEGAPGINDTNETDGIGRDSSINKTVFDQSSDEGEPIRPHPGDTHREVVATRLNPVDDGGAESLAEPEIRGLWDETQFLSKAGGDNDGVPRRHRSKAELDMMRNAMDKLKKSSVIKQVAAGKEFKGQAFISKPSEVVFQDFELGKTYRKKLQLTNISYSFNYCKLIGVTDNLKDFVSIEFNPPGSISAGLTCHMVVIFEPKLDEDITGHIDMLSQTGPFTIPVKCITKKCLITADKTEVNFGKVCLGETVRRQIVLSNKGALPTRFAFGPKSLEPPTLQVQEAETSESRDRVNSGQLSDKSFHSVMSNVEKGASRMDMLVVGPVGGEGRMSRSTGDLSSASQKSISWVDNKQTDGDDRCDTNGDNPANREANEVDGDAPCDDKVAQSKEDSKDLAAVSLPALEFSEVGPPSIHVGKVTEGEIDPFSSCVIDVVFSPEVASEQSAEFILNFSHPAVPHMTISARGCGVDLPVWVERERLDMRVCMLDRLYQDTVVLHNRTPVALRVTFEVPLILKPHLEVQPKYGVIQGESSYAAQLKFIPKRSILDGSCEQFSVEGGSLEMPVEVHVVNQSRPVTFTVSARVTPADISFDKDAIEFGTCTTHESVVTTLELTNTSLLPQSFGFINLPSYVDIQPGDGFGELLPNESLSMDVIFSAGKPKEYSFVLTIKTAIDRTYRIPCHGVGVLPALELSENAINFTATALDNTSIATVTVHNPRLSRLNSAVIRGALLPQGPKMFEFAVPSGCPITVCPQVGEIPLGESVNVQIQFSPKLEPESIKEEALRLTKKEMVRLAEEANRLEEAKVDMEQQVSKKKGKPKVSQPRPSSSKNSMSSTSQIKQTDSSSKELIAPEPETPKEGSDTWWQAYNNLLTSYANSCLQLSIPCFVSSETSATNLITPPHRPEDTLYLEVTAPIVRPGLIVISDGGRTNIDFDSLGTGDARTKMISVKNITDQALHLKSSVLDPHGPFEMRNALRDLSPGATTNLIVRFSPSSGGEYYEHLVLHYGTTSTLQLKLSGTGIQPEVSLSLDSDCLNLEHVMVGDTVQGSLQLNNSCPLCVRYTVQLESSLPKSSEKRKKKGLPFRATNYNGEPPFTCVTCEGTIEGCGGSSEISVSFTPDHQSSSYADTMYIDLNGHRAYTIQLRGRAWTNNMYILTDEITVSEEQTSKASSAIQLSNEESMAATLHVPDGQSIPPQPLVLLFVHHLSNLEPQDKDGDKSSPSLHNSSNDSLRKNGGNKSKVNTADGDGAKVTRELHVGCIKTSLVKKATGEFSIEALPSSNPHSKLFTINPMKSSVEAGGSKTISLTFSPPKDTSTHIIEASTNLILKGDSSQTYRLLLRRLICE